MMKMLFVKLLLLVHLGLFAQTGTLTILVTNLENNNGLINVALYNEANKSTFLKDTKSASQRKIIEINNRKAVLMFSDVPFGTYAISVFHDENKNGKIDRTFIGFPSEATGISGNKFTFGPPNFDHAKFILDSKEKKILIKVISIL